MDGGFECGLCKKWFRTKSNFNRHMNGVHNKSKKNNYNSKCEFCSKCFRDSYNLNRHLASAHSEGNAKTFVETKKYACVHCSKRFSKKLYLENHLESAHFIKSKWPVKKCDKCEFETRRSDYLKIHILKQHNNKSNNKQECPRSVVKCKYCNAKFSYVKSLKQHERRLHGVSDYVCAKVRRKCPICPFVSYERKQQEVNSHFAKKHGIAMKWEALNFTNIKLFNTWKHETEKNTTTQYVKKGCGKNRLHFHCHRSGTYRPKEVRQRRLKIKGSSKINGFCPSEIKVVINDNGSIKVQYMPVHVGHETELKHMRLSPEEREAIINQLVNKVSHEDILKGIKSSITNFELNRIHLTTKKDLFNIEKSINLNEESPRHPFDPSSIDIWVQELADSTETALLVYKPQGVVSTEFPELLEEDFVLIFMTNAQNKFLKHYGNDTICIDNTHGINSKSFQLYTVLAFDESREGFPAAFMFSNRGDDCVLALFFENLKQVTGPLNPRVFMSDMEDTFYQTWSRFMGHSTFQLYCSWAVLNVWRSNLNKIKKSEKKREVYKILRALLYELEENTFHKLLEDTLLKFETDDHLKEYGNYFTKYMQREMYIKWAYCYRVNAGINTNISLVSFNRVLKYCNLRGKKIQRLDKTLCAIVNLIKDKLFDWFLGIKKSKPVDKLQALKQRHQSSILLSEKNIVQSDLGWQVLSPSCQDKYSVNKIKDCRKCSLPCLLCDSCIHEYACSCIDNTIKRNMCEHIHLVARYNNNTTGLTANQKDTLITNEEESETESSIEPTIVTETIEVTDDSRKVILANKVNELEKYINERDLTPQQMDFLETNLNEIFTKLESMDAVETGFGQ